MRSLRAPVILSSVLLLLGLLSLLAAAVGDGISLSLGTISLLGSTASIGLQVGAVSAVLLTFIAGLALITAEYSRRNLRGQARLARYAAWHMVAALSLALLVTGASLPVMAVGWSVSGVAIARLVAHRNTSAALQASRYVQGRLFIADALLWSAVLVAAAILPSLDRASLGASASSSVSMTALALLLVAAAVVRSSLVPAHRWLYETAEAPSPVSALLHAGVVNAVGLVGVLLWPILAAAPIARAGLIVIGAGSAVAMTVAGRYRADVKGRLAASTGAQMGYLSIQVGLGLPLAGMLHLIGHGCYKAHLFLRAGGEISRARHSLAAARRISVPIAILAVALAGAGALAGAATWAAVPVADALPIVAAAAAASVAIAAVLAPGRGMRTLVGWAPMLGSSLLIGGLLAGYVALLGWWTAAFPGFAGASEVWSTAALMGWFALLAATTLLTLVVLRRLAAGRMPRVRAVLAAASLPPGARLHASFRSSDLLAAPAGTPVGQVGFAVAAAEAVVGPAFPLRHAVAANPIAGLQDLHVRQAARVTSQTWGARSLPERSTYRRAFANGRITQADLRAAAAQSEGLGGHAPGLVANALLAVSSQVPAADPLLRSATAGKLNALTADEIAGLNAASSPDAVIRTRTEQWDAASQYLRMGSGAAPLTEVADAHAATWLLDLLAVESAPYDSGQLWRAWRQRVAAPGMDRRLGARGFGAAVAGLPDEPLPALEVLLADVPADEHIGYLGRLLARAPGWSAHLAWRRWVQQPDLGADLLAIRAAYDILLTRAALALPHPRAATSPVASQRVVTATSELLHELGHGPHEVSSMDVAEVAGLARLAALLVGPAGDEVWQAAFEQRYRNRMLDRIEARAAAGPDPRPRPEVHLAMCIDVRSERLRRHLEQDSAVATYGFAGFFGLAVRHVPSSGAAADQCPVLLTPGSDLPERLNSFGSRQAAARLLGGATTAVGAVPAAPFALAEAAAPVSGLLAMAQTLAPRQWRSVREWIRGPVSGLRGTLAVDAALSDEQQVAAAYGFLHAVGLHKVEGSLLVIAGHGAVVENNAYAAAYDCGACGGNAGYVNARMMAELINRAGVRAGLADRGIILDDGLIAVPALHVTTTDALHIDDADVPQSAAQAVSQLRMAAAAAQIAAATERVATLPSGRIDHALRDVERRAADWAEATPEWGLAGNALFVAGPRWMTRGLNLHGRSFLHSYEPALDTDQAVLETILTAPMVVAQWINSQYFASTVDPVRFGAGDKTTHNVVGDFAVLSGAHGDLRIGLPWQGLFDADPTACVPGIAHEPMRLQVVVYARPEDVLSILTRHAQVLRLITGEWLALAVIDPTDASVHRLTPALTWQDWDTDPLSLEGAELPIAQPERTL